MPAKNYLNREQVEKLQKALKEEENGYIRERILMLLLLNDGKTQAKIAEFLGCSINKVSYWCIHGDPDNLESLKDKRMRGNHKKATDKYIEILLETIDKEPEELGYDFGRWTAQRLAIYLESITGIQLSGSQVRRILERKKYVYRWAKYSLETKRNPEKRKAFKEKIEEYLKIEKASPEQLQVWFWDESGFSLRVIRRKNWGKKGSRKKVRGDRRKGRVNVMGGLRHSDKKRFVEFVDKGNAENFYQVLIIFYKELINEWVEAGNQPKDFAKKGAKIVIILDNASFHKKEEYIKRIEAEMPNIHLGFLPEYSPDYNLIELVWHSTKEYVANRLFKSVEELEYLLHQLLNEGELIIKWGRKIKNKGDALTTV
ncbi:IS630 family transposase [Funiculus sociatus GB2-A5]|uniref:IS630 family transposase n=1 Tax=Funiculus sociatus GB2-A5 TaxID=2933946 RepID=A0ABV0JXA5_9CYAN|nr:MULTISPECIES: IS630 family transposase [unclassified Trichocoleus]MBD1906783.1 IS630 family transposase [Trichocoleus sp. FACHB-832]MBD2062705.1 IS630 family transposase [Trichocoleus sp. FACHB-6]